MAGDPQAVTLDPRFTPPVRGKDCLNCDHHVFADGIACNHPSRPQRPIAVIKWAAGCPQHVPLKETP